MVKVKMLRNKLGSPAGHTVEHFQEGEEYDIPETLAKAFVEDDRVAEYVDAEPAEPKADKPEAKAEKPLKNKADKPEANKTA